MVPVDESRPRQNCIVKIFAKERICRHYDLPFLSRLVIAFGFLRHYLFHLEYSFMNKVLVRHFRCFDFDLILDLLILPDFYDPSFSLSSQIILADANVDVEAKSL